MTILVLFCHRGFVSGIQALIFGFTLCHHICQHSRIPFIDMIIIPFTETTEIPLPFLKDIYVEGDLRRIRPVSCSRGCEVGSVFRELPRPLPSS